MELSDQKIWKGVIQMLSRILSDIGVIITVSLTTYLQENLEENFGTQEVADMLYHFDFHWDKLVILTKYNKHQLLWWSTTDSADVLK